MKSRKIEVVKYNPAWPKRFDTERKRLRRTLGEVAKRIHHMGSTAVPGLAAKPIIDILVEVTDLDALDRLNSAMEAIGYEPKGEFGIPGRRHFQKGGNRRTHHIHAFKRGDFNVLRYIAFRDYLRSHPEVSHEYGELKKRIAKACEDDIDRYCSGKEDYVKELEKKALNTQKHPTMDAPDR